MEKNELLEIRNIIEDIKNNGVNEKYIKEIYKYLGNKNIPLIFNNKIVNTAHFTPKFNVISVNLNKSKDWTKQVINDSIDSFEVSDIKLLDSYLYVTLLAHEIEHSNQKLIADNKKEPNYEYKKQAYHDIFDIMLKKDYIIPRPISLVTDLVRFIIYTKNAYDFILERNATIESYDVTSKIANLTEDKDILDYMLSSRNAFMLMGYNDNSEGTLKYTYDKLGMMNKYNRLVFPNDISLFERAREGLELTEDESNKMLRLLRESSKFKN